MHVSEGPLNNELSLPRHWHWLLSPSHPLSLFSSSSSCTLSFFLCQPPTPSPLNHRQELIITTMSMLCLSNTPAHCGMCYCSVLPNCPHSSGGVAGMETLRAGHQDTVSSVMCVLYIQQQFVHHEAHGQISGMHQWYVNSLFKSPIKLTHRYNQGRQQKTWGCVCVSPAWQYLGYMVYWCPVCTVSLCSATRTQIVYYCKLSEKNRWESTGLIAGKLKHIACVRGFLYACSNIIT